jgi:sterol desaturase/sphingolipid hydroxylase (fatty acid hydroxylase superfamily)
VDTSLAVAATYFAALVGGFALIGVWETVASARPARAATPPRWASNFALMAVNQGLLTALTPISNAGTAWFAGERGIGVFNVLDAPVWLAFAATLVAMDAARYAIHRLFHAIPLLWRLHRVHHSDLDYDLTVGLRFHPLETVVANALLTAVVLALGAPFWAVVASDALTIAHGFFAHGNVALPRAFDRVLRRFLVTPAMHTTHHSIEPDESMSNLGSLLPWWDRLFGTYRERPRAGDAIAFGLADERDPARLRLPRLLAMPFAR